MVNIAIKEIVDLSQLNTYKTGGFAKYLIAPNNDNELIEAINFAESKGEKYQILGAGSNVLISDSGYDGVVILLTTYNNFIEGNDNIIRAGAGVQLNKLISYAIDNGLGGLELLSGIPGLVGGGVKMNAGAYGIEFKDFTISADIISNGRLITLANNDIGFGYRKADRVDDGAVVSSVSVKVVNDDISVLTKKRSEILKIRSEKQPLHKPSCGSVFKRPSVGYAGEYIEKAGLKGFIYNGAMISQKHANFILNNSNATSSDIKYIIDLVISKVFDEFGVVLEPEVKLIGEFS